MERYYDGDQEQLYTEARVVNPYRKSINAQKKVFIINLFIYISFYKKYLYFERCI